MVTNIGIISLLTFKLAYLLDLNVPFSKERKEYALHTLDLPLLYKQNKIDDYNYSIIYVQCRYSL